MANIGSEIGRAISWKNKRKSEYNREAFFKTLELLDLTLNDPKNLERLKELVRLREVLADYFYGKNEFHSSNQVWQGYFFAFSWAAQLRKS